MPILNPKASTRLTVRVQRAVLGKNWYITSTAKPHNATDQVILDAVRSTHPDATGVEITRRYSLEDSSAGN